MSNFAFAGDSCFDFTQDRKGLVLAKDLSQDVLANAKGALIVILEVKMGIDGAKMIEWNGYCPLLGNDCPLPRHQSQVGQGGKAEQL